MDSSGPGGTVSALDQQRSFNLVRLRAIEVSRNLAATSFYQEELNLTTDQSSVADNNNSNSGSIDNLPDPVSGAGRASAASRYGRDTVLTPALIHLQLEQFNDHYYHQQKQLQQQQQQQPQVATTVQTATPRGSALVNEAADADDESDEWLALSILELKAPHLPLPAHPPPPPPSKKIRRRRRRRRSTVSSPPAAMVPPDPSTALSVRGLHFGGARQQR